MTSSDSPVDEPPAAQSDQDLAKQLRQAELRLAGARRQLDERLTLIQQLRGRVELANAERDQARADLALIRNSRTFRYSESARRLYGRLRTRWLARRHR